MQRHQQDRPKRMCRMPGRGVQALACCGLVAVALPVWPSAAWAQRAANEPTQGEFPAPPNTETPSADEERRAKLREERQRLWDEANQLLADDKPQEAIAAAERMLAIERELYGDEHNEVALTLHWLGSARLTIDDVAGAREQFAAATAILAKLLPAGHWRLVDEQWEVRTVDLLAKMSAGDRQALFEAERQSNRCLALADEGRVDEALEAIRQALAVEQRLLPALHPELARGFNNLFYVLDTRREHVEAKQAIEKAISLREKLYAECPTGHPQLATSLNNMSQVCYHLNDILGAVEYQRRVLTMRQKLHPPEDYPRGHAEIAQSHDQLGYMLFEQGDMAGAVEQARLCLAMNEQLYPAEEYPDGHPSLAGAMDSLAFLVRNQGDVAEARALYERSLAMREKLFPVEEYPNGHFDLSQSLHSMGRMCEVMGDYPTAKIYYERAIAMREKLYPPDLYPNGDAGLATSISNLSVVLYQLQDFDGAIAVGLRALAMRERLYPRDRFPGGHPDLSTSYTNLGAFYESKGDYQQALRYNEQALAVSERMYPPEQFPNGHPELANDLNNLAGVYDKLGNLQQALALYERALAMKEKLFSPEHYPRGSPSLVSSINNLAHCLHNLGDYSAARPYFLRSLAMSRDLFPPDQFPRGHYYIALCLANMGFLASDQGNLREAYDYTAQALAMRRQLYPISEYPRGTEDLLNSLSDMAMSLENVGDYAGARAIYDECLDVAGRLYPAAEYPNGHPEVALLQLDVANLLGRFDETATARSYYDQALTTLERLYPAAEFPQGHPDLLHCLTNYADFFEDNRDRKGAEALYRRALAMAEQIYSADRYPQGHPTLAVSINNLGSILRTQGQYAEAEQLLTRSLEMALKLFPVERFPDGHPNIANEYNSLGNLYSRLGKRDLAVQNYRLSLAMRERLYPPEKFPQGNPGLAIGLNNLALELAEQGQTDQAYVLMTRAYEMEQAILRNVLAGSSEEVMRVFVNKNAGQFEQLVTLARQQPEQGPAMALTYRAVLDRKTAILDALLALRQFERLTATDPEIGDLTNQLRGLRQQLADMALRPQTPESVARRQEVAGEARRLEARLNRALSTRLAGGEPADRIGTSAAVAAQLPEKTVMVELVRWQSWLFDAPLDVLPFEEPRYSALVMKGADETSLTMVDLGSADEIDKLVEELRQVVISTNRQLQVASEEQLEQDYRRRAAVLSERVLGPLREVLAGANHLIVAPDGQLAAFPWEALVDQQGNYVIENLAVSYASSGGDLLRTTNTTSQGTIVFAAPDYKLDGRPAAVSTELASLLRGGPDATDLAEQPLSDVLAEEVRGLNWDPLPATLEESRQIARLLGDNSAYQPVITLTGADALEDTLKRIRSPRILHLATHGFYIPGRSEETDPTAPAEVDRGGATAAARQARLARSDNPLLRAGLVLAGANRKERPETLLDPSAAAEVAPSAVIDDGWVTAEEIGLLDLAGTELVVLSACETGLGDVKMGEGVTGLRRAFVHAGAQTLVTSLYKVPDAATQQLMVEFYERLAAGRPKFAALQEAEKAVIAQRRQEHGAAHPFFWASFILVGNPN